MRHGSTRAVTFAATSVHGEPQQQTGLVHVPHVTPPGDGFPVVVYGHMTTGGSDSSAPSRGGTDHPEWRRMSQGDALCDLLLERGIAVLRPDYEGIGSGGMHPYLIGASLAESMTAMMRARRELDERMGDRWVVAGHSEGAVAALWASVGGEPDATSHLCGTAAFAPVTRMDVSTRLARALCVRVAGSGVVSALIGLMLGGAAITDERLRALIVDEGLSAQARARLPDLDRLCLTELAEADSWGAISPGRIGGRDGDEVFERLHASFRANEVARLAGFRTPVRVDTALYDEVAPAPLSRRLLTAYRNAGVELTSRWWPTHHSGVMHPKQAPSEAVAWIAACLERAAK